MNKKVFVTGGTGFIGRHLVLELLKSNDVVLLTRRLKVGFAAHNNLTVVRGDLLDKSLLEKALKGCTLAYHLAACIDFNPKNKDCIYKTNITGTRNLLEAASRSGVGKIIFTSSACTIGISSGPDNPLNEETAFVPSLLESNVYLASKKIAEETVLSFAGGMDVIIANPTTVFGPGDYNLNSGTLIKAVYMSKVLPVPPGGTSVTDVSDVVAGLLLLSEKGRAGQRYIFTSENLSFAEIFRQIAEVTGRRPLFIKLPARAGKLFNMSVDFGFRVLSSCGFNNAVLTPRIIKDTFLFKYYDPKKAKTELGWKPVFSLKESVKRAFDFYLREGLFK